MHRDGVRVVVPLFGQGQTVGAQEVDAGFRLRVCGSFLN